jgi:hypothetical protein
VVRASCGQAERHSSDTTQTSSFRNALARLRILLDIRRSWPSRANRSLRERALRQLNFSQNAMLCAECTNITQYQVLNVMMEV